MYARKTDFKIVIIGDSFIGKTALLKKFIGKIDIGRSIFESHEVEKDGEKILLEIHDTKGQERYRSLTSSFYRGAQGCLVCFNVMSNSSFDGLKHWMDDVRECVREDIPKILVGINRNNGYKQPLDHSQKISRDKIDAFCELHKLHYIEIDLNDVKRISDCFETLTDMMVKERRRRTSDIGGDMDIVHFPRPREEKKEQDCGC
ncbi:ras-related protein Rab-11A-like [Mercenaria mercenaria]|uniref:ras-related protein Rab-11A-like n=1 Tax=Mercenaria mercenaria TaxID=6596 RepID=UPI001E1E1B47|nr:ras-related protein Rab-11A-like [Mercenaria mercenaria]